MDKVTYYAKMGDAVCEDCGTLFAAADFRGAKEHDEEPCDTDDISMTHEIRDPENDGTEQEFETCKECGRPKTEFIGEDMRCWWCWVRNDITPNCRTTKCTNKGTVPFSVGDGPVVYYCEECMSKTLKPL